MASKAGKNESVEAIKTAKTSVTKLKPTLLKELKI